MIKNDFIKLKVSSGLKQNYSGLGYDFSKEEVYFKVDDLKDVSNQRVDVICDLCENEYNIQYCKYVKNIKRNGYYSCKECGLKARKEMMINKNLSLNKDYQFKKKETFIKNYGVDNPSKSNEIKEKKKETCLKNFGVDNGLKLREKIQNGMIEKYGVDHPMKSEIIRKRLIENTLSKYGVDNISKLDDVKKQKKETCFKNYGVYYPSQCEEIVKKQILKYKQNYFEKYGVTNPMHRKEIFEKMLLSTYKIIYYNEELFAQGTYELHFLNYCEEKGVLNLISNGPSLNYILESQGTEHMYHSDFYIEKLNLIIEIKSSYTYNYDLEKNLSKEKCSKLNGYNFLFLIDKDYNTFDEILKNNL
jgi:hypothetical protein